MVEEARAESVGGDPIAVQQKSMNFVGEDVLLEGRALGAQGLGQADGVGELHIAVVVALDKQDGGLPGFNGSEWRGFPREVGDGGIGEGIVRAPVLKLEVPVFHAVEVDARGKEIGGTGQRERGEIATVASAPHADVRAVDIGPAAQVEPCAPDVVELTRAGGAVVEGFAEVETVADPAAVVDR